MRKTWQKLHQYRLPECNDQRTRSDRERPNPKHKSQNTKDTSPPPSLSLLSLSCVTQVCVSVYK